MGLLLSVFDLFFKKHHLVLSLMYLTSFNYSPSLWIKAQTPEMMDSSTGSCSLFPTTSISHLLSGSHLHGLFPVPWRIISHGLHTWSFICSNAILPDFLPRGKKRPILQISAILSLCVPSTKNGINSLLLLFVCWLSFF